MAITTMSMTCPVTNITSSERVMLAHGEGGRLMRQLIHRRIMPAVDNEFLRIAGDAAVLPKLQGPIAMTTDSFVVSPLFFPGGDIGSLAVYGTINDLAVAGAAPRWISLALILEEGLEIAVLEQVLASVAVAAKRAGVLVVTGDTKVVPRGAADQIFINTTGIGEMVAAPPAGPHAIEIGDELIVTGPIARHGIAVMAAREGLAFEPPPQSDSAPLVDAVVALQQASIPLRALRDATRGGVSAVLHEWAETSGKTLIIEERLLPVTPVVRGACELLGLDPIHVANEGTMVIAVPQGCAHRAIQVLRKVHETSGSVCIGHVGPRGLAAVLVERIAGQEIPLDEPIGAPLPRIC
ncbi:MAG TPA: hydrogenase expression/formation protein HypE [Lacipirellulaceae bacterium]